MLFPRTAACLVLSALVSSVSSYFVVTGPALNDQWANGDTRAVSWVKGVNDGVTSFDLEMSQLTTDGLTLIAKNVPSGDSSQKSINIQLQDVPPGDDYFLLFINSTNGAMYATSPRFTVLASGGTSNGTTTTNAKAATVTVSGAPNPTAPWATTFAIATSAASRPTFAGLSTLLLAAVWTLLW